MLKLSISLLMALFFLPTVNAQNQNGSMRVIMSMKSLQGTTGMKRYAYGLGLVEPSLVFKPFQIEVDDKNGDRVAEFNDPFKLFFYPNRPSGELHPDGFTLMDMTKNYNSSSGSINLRKNSSFKSWFNGLEANGGAIGFYHYTIPRHAYWISTLSPTGNVPADYTISIKGETREGTTIPYPYHFNFETTYYIDAIEPNLKIQNLDGDAQTVFCERQLIQIVAEYKRPFYNGNFEFQKSYDEGVTWEMLPSYWRNVTFDYATQSGVTYRARLVASSTSYGVNDYNSFKATSNADITVLPQLSDIYYQTFGVCPGNSTGSVKINGLPGAVVGDDYLITIDDGAGYSENVTVTYANNYFTDIDISFAVPVGTYSITATNLSSSARCGLLKENISVSESYTPKYNYSTKGARCAGDNGRIDLYSQRYGNDTDVATFVLLDSTQQSWTRIINWHRHWTSLTNGPGAYQVTIENSDLCSYEIPDTIFIEPADSVLTTITANTIQELNGVEYIGCPGASTSLQLNISGGIPPYRIWEHYSGSGGSNGRLYYTNGTSITIPRKGAGNHTFSVRDGRWCVSERDTITLQTIPEVNFPTLNEITPTTVCGAVLDDGAIEQLSPPSGGFPPYSLYFNGAEVSTFDTMNMPNARARLSIVDSSGCVATHFPALLNTGFLRIAEYESYDGSIDPCGINSTAVARLNVDGGTIASEYTMTINGAPCVAPECTVMTSLSGPSAVYEIRLDSAGVYNYEVTDDTGCTISHVSEYAKVTIPKIVSMSVIPPSCTNGTHMATFLIEDLEFRENHVNAYTTYILDGVPGATTLLESDGELLSPYQFTIPITGDSMHQIVLVTETNCSSSTPYEFSLEGVSSISIDVTNIEMAPCSYDTSGTIIFSMGGNAPHIVELFRDSIRQDSVLVFGGEHRYDNLLSGNYRIDITDNSGCTQSENNIILTNPAPIEATLSNVNAIDCTGNNGLIQLSNVSGGIAPYQFSLNGQSYQSNTLLEGALLENEIIVRDSNNCELTLAWDVPLAGPTLFPTITQLSPVSDCTLGNALLNLPAGFTYPLSVAEIESPNNYYSDKEQRTSDSLATVAYADTLSELFLGKHYFLISDGLGCETIDSIVITAATPLFAFVSGNTEESCYFQSGDGTITVSVSGGLAPYTIEMTGDTSFVTNDSTTFTGLDYGYYAFNIQDSNGCFYNVEDSIVAGSLPLLTDTTANYLGCSGIDLTAEVTLTGYNGVGPYSFEWEDGNTDNPRTGVEPGEYLATVTDVNGCTNVDVIIMLGVDSLELNINTTLDINCQADSTGQISVTTTGAFEPYTFSIDNGNTFQTDSLFTNLPVGNHTILVKDDHNCTDTTSATITYANPLTASVSSANETCNLANDGSLQVSILGGIAPFTYSLDNINFQFQNTFSDLSAGTYTVWIQDGSGCKAVYDNNVITEPALLTLSTNVVTPETCSASNGSISGMATGGTAPYSYEWNGDPALNNNTLTNIASGTYTLVVTDANLCTESSTIVLTNSLSPALTLQSSANETCGMSNGQIDLAITNGVAPFNFNWSHSGTLNDSLATGLSAGTYNVTITDANMCSAVLTTSLTEIAGPTLSLQSNTNPVCTNDNGMITVALANGTAPFTYSWSHNAILNNNTATSLPAGNYEVTVTDGNGCSDILTSSLSFEAPPVFGTSTVVNVTCGETNGSIQTSLTGGVAPLTYTWSHNPTLNASTATLLTAGNYSVTVTDALGCTSVESNLAIVTLTPPSLNIESTNNETCGMSNGQIDLAITNGVVPFSFNWSHNGTLNDSLATGLSAGTYNVTITDANMCTAVLTTSLTEIAAPTLTLQSNTNPVCTNDNGTITVALANGTAPFTYSWSHNATLNNNTATSLPAGNYEVTVTDGNGCSDVMTSSISFEAPPIFGTSTLVNATCGETNGSIQTSLTGGVAPLTYTWSHESTLNASTATLLPDGNYSVTVTDALGCTSIEGNLAIIAQTPPSLNINITNNSNCLIPMGMISVQTTGGLAPFVYSWSHDGSLTGPNATDLGAGNYTITVTDSNGCTKTEVANLIDGQGADLSLESSQPEICGMSNGEINLAISSGVAPFTFNWSHDNTLNDSLATGLPAGTYSITVTDVNMCSAVLTTSIAEIAGPTLSLQSNTNPICTNDNGNITVALANGTAPFSYSWSHDVSLNNNTSTSLPAGSYTVTVTDGNACTDVLTTNLTFEMPPVLVPAALVDASCDEANGSIQVALTGGVAPLTYQWSHDPTLNSAVATALVGGNYSVTTTDALGCSAELNNMTISDLTPPVLSILSFENTGCENPTGSISVTTIGGLAPLTYAWNHNAGLTTGIATNLSEGDYNITVTDASGCTSASSVSIAVTDSPVLTLQSSTNEICGTNNGEIDLTISNGAAPFTFNWSHSNTLNDSLATGLMAGTYTVTVTDANTCSSVLTASLIEIAGPTLTLVSNNNSVCTDDNGSISVDLSNGTAPFAYSWSHDFTLNNNIATGLPAGDYEVTVGDVNGCTSVLNTSISFDAPPDLALVSIVHAICDGANGSIQLSMSGGTAPLTYQWSHDPTLTGDAASLLIGGDYSVTITDALGCTTFEDNMTITNLTPPTLSVASFNNTDCLNAMGDITVQTAGGLAPFTYTWSHDSSLVGATANGLSSGAYSITVTDVNGCESIVMQNLIEFEGSLEITNELDCSYSSDGSLLLTLQGNPTDYDYEWSDATIGNTNIATNLSMAMYTVTVTNSNGCTQDFTMNLMAPEELSLNISEVIPVGCNGNLGSIVAQANGGTGAYSYLWNDANNQNTAVANNLTTGVYELLLTDANGCTATETAEVVQAATMELTTNLISNLNCFGDENGSVEVVVTQGEAPYTYLWNNNETTSILTDLTSGNYTVTVTDAVGCTEMVSTPILAPDLLTVEVNAIEVPLCHGDNNGSVILTTIGGVAPYQYSWDDDQSQTTASATGLISGVYTVLITDANGCTFTDVFTLADPEAIVLVNETVSSVSCLGTPNGAITISAEGGTQGLNYNWSNGATGTNLEGLSTGIYQVSLVDGLGCESIENFLVGLIDVDHIDLGSEDTILCNNDVIFYDFSNSGYIEFEWGSMAEGVLSNESSFSTTGEESYYLYALRDDGCEVRDTIAVNFSAATLDAFFIAPTDIVAGDTLVALEVTLPVPDSVFWDYDRDNVFLVDQINNQYLFHFPNTGEYDLTLTSYSENCNNNITKPVFVYADSTELPFFNSTVPTIVDLNLFPNPNSGTFSIDVTLSGVHDMVIDVYNDKTDLIDRAVFSGEDVYKSEYELNLPAGIYYALVQVAGVRRTISFVVD